MEEVKHMFKPEFLNRIDDIIVFHALEEVHLKKITNLLCATFIKRVEKNLRIKLTVRDSIKKHIIEKGSDTKYGARPLKRAIQVELEDKMADEILSGRIQEGMSVSAGYSKGAVVFTPEVVETA